MKYLCLIYTDEKTLAGMTREQIDSVIGECVVYDDSLRRSGQLIAVEKLQPVATASTVRVRNGKVSVTDGPFAETKEHLGGFYLIEAGDLEEAIGVASRIPPARLGSIEVRPIEVLPG